MYKIIKFLFNKKDILLIIFLKLFDTGLFLKAERHLSMIFPTIFLG